MELFWALCGRTPVPQIIFAVFSCIQRVWRRGQALLRATAVLGLYLQEEEGCAHSEVWQQGMEPAGIAWEGGWGSRAPGSVVPAPSVWAVLGRKAPQSPGWPFSWRSRGFGVSHALPPERVAGLPPGLVLRDRSFKLFSRNNDREWHEAAQTETVRWCSLKVTLP